MTDAERDELIDLYSDNALPEALRACVETYLAAHPEADADESTLQWVVSRLHAAPSERPDGWFVERALDRLLSEHAAAQETQQDTERMTSRRI